MNSPTPVSCSAFPRVQCCSINNVQTSTNLFTQISTNLEEQLSCPLPGMIYKKEYLEQRQIQKLLLPNYCFSINGRDKPAVRNVKLTLANWRGGEEERCKRFMHQETAWLGQLFSTLIGSAHFYSISKTENDGKSQQDRQHLCNEKGNTLVKDPSSSLKC